MMWSADRSRYMAGWDCEWRRLLGYHAFGSGLTPATISQPLATGTYVHMALEAMLRGQANGVDEIQAAIDPVLAAYRQYAAGTDLPIDEQCALVEGLTHAYGRIVMPWLTDCFDIIQIEQEGVLTLPNGVRWMYRPDFVTRYKDTGSIAVHDFKTASSWSENRDVAEYESSVQMMMNAYGVSQQLGKPVDFYYIHILLKGNDYSPSPLIHPYYRMANPPLQQEDIQAYYKYTDANGSTRYLGKSYSRCNIWEIGKVRDWVWSMPDSDCAKQTVVIGPYSTDPNKVAQFIRGVMANESVWRERMNIADTLWDRWADPKVQEALDGLFPRTYKCYTWGSRCAYYDLCHKNDGWQTPLTSGRFERRVPHHTTEVTDGSES